ncbi:adenosylmethionine--8-amino-7-oxononanoate transaminase [Nitrincola nitratireducens]|uniref:Adenosylmethionine-8-amino-7-oxononanoate aminotransferase n=1 Tax=Nitrincola nitratireducens TaxID=1229521 RepID=W9VM81_9GAMM|nr:adenosylmethionine--8-amino-7-oxononanoate transaminase [Nitrincola nitratireducens]EXJ11625.1 Adenosylmethionine-8-amino-7-oxononanoate aminotransferase [Nitrincola nitratireducens]
MHDPKLTDALAFDREHIWHPYSSMTDPLEVYPVTSAKGVRITLANGQTLIDGMASWWSVIHGYGHPRLNQAAKNQIDAFSHVMFGGLTHMPAMDLAQKLVQITPDGLEKVFFSDSGSVSVEVAIKMALQYQQARGYTRKNRIISLRRGYHGDTFAAMSVCDPVTGMHQIFQGALPSQIFLPAPETPFGEALLASDLDALERTFKQHHTEAAALILEPIVQGAGGMRFYSADYIRHARRLCDQYGCLLIADEIATGFGRTGQLFACEHANIAPDILCLGKALTGGYLSLAATLTTDHVAKTISQGGAGCFMHGPTFMANPLACAIALESVTLLLEGDWKSNILRLEAQLTQHLAILKNHPKVADVRCLGGIGVVELNAPCELKRLQPKFVEEGIWVRPFGKLVYVMPPYVITDEDLATLCQGIVRVVTSL